MAKLTYTDSLPEARLACKEPPLVALDRSRLATVGLLSPPLALMLGEGLYWHPILT